MKTLRLYFKNSAEWRTWLEENHSEDITVWMVFYKKATGKPSIEYKEALDEALCFGWIDSIIKRIDDKKYVRKFTGRKDNSKWSEINKRRSEELILEGKMTAAGLLKIEEAKKNGQWFKINTPNISFTLPDEFKYVLRKNKKAKINFEELSTTYKKQYIGWITTAKLETTRRKRINESIKLLSEGKKLGLK